MTVSDPILELGSNNLNTGDIGLVMTRHGASNSNVAVFFDESEDVLKLGYTLNGAGDSTLEFDSNALAVSIQGALTAASISGPLTGNADTAAALETARTINGVSFDGTGNITITANTPNTLTRGLYLTGSDFDGSAATTWAVDATTTNTASKIVARDGNGDIFGSYVNMSHGAATRSTDTVFYSSTDNYIRKTNATGMRASLNVPTRTGGDASGTWGISITGNAATATALETARNIGGVSFDGSANIDLPGVNTIGNQDTTGNADTATALETARTIALTGDVTGSATFDGSGNISISTTSSGGGSWTSSGTNIYYNSGNVGIGTTNPQGALHISSGTSGDAHLIIEADTDNNNESDNPKIVFRQDGGFYTGELGLDNNHMVFRSKSTLTNNTGFVFYSNVALGGTSKTDINDIEDTQVEVMRIGGDGNVGIGTSSPTANLDVNGYIAHNNPVFYAHNFGNGGGTTSSGNYIVYRNTEVNIGSNFSTSTGIFTCPRNGVYKFTWGAIGNNSDTVYRYYIRINNANIINGTHNRLDNTASGSNFGNGTSSIILSLSTNDTVRIYYLADNGSSSSYGFNYDIFMGYMISA
jgi:hypothetical protein